MSTVFRVYNESTDQWEAILAGEQGVQGPQGWQGQEGAGFQGPQGWQGIAGSLTLSGTTDDGIITYNSGGTGTVESNLTFNSGTNTLNVNGNITATDIDAKASCVNNTNDNTCLKFWSGTQAQYDALTPAADTIYFIV